MIESGISDEEATVHRLSWTDFDRLARNDAGIDIVCVLRRAERSRRLLLLRALVDEAGKNAAVPGPLAPPEEAWDVLARVQEKRPDVLELMLAHPYTGTWAGYTMRLLCSNITGVCPLWMHVGHLHSLAAAAACRAGLGARIAVPAWKGGVILPTLGMALLDADAPWSVAEVRTGQNAVEIDNGTRKVRVPRDPSQSGPGWWGIRHVHTEADGRGLSIRLDDLDPYRGLREPVGPRRLDAAEVGAWQTDLDRAWRLIARHAPPIADALTAGLDSLVPGGPSTRFRPASASTGEAFGSAVVVRSPDTATMAATLVHEFQHIRLGGLLSLTRLHNGDPQERFYTPWRDDPRPIGGALQGVYAFFGVTEFWRALARGRVNPPDHRALLEFAYWRAQTWRTLAALRDAAGLTPAGQRFTAGVAERLGPWLREPVPPTMVAIAGIVAADHYAGWRLRHLRADPAAVVKLAEAWLSGRTPPTRIRIADDGLPTPVPDGAWSHARADLIRLSVGEAAAAGPHRTRPSVGLPSAAWSAVPDATSADIAFAAGRLLDAVSGYRAELAVTPDRPASWVGLGLTLSARGSTSAAHMLLRSPETVRAVHRLVRAERGENATTPDELAAWIGRVTC